VTIAPATVQGRQKKIIEKQHVEKGFTGLAVYCLCPRISSNTAWVDSHHGIIIILSVKIIS
jgi:hypothetical protein